MPFLKEEAEEPPDHHDPVPDRLGRQPSLQQMREVAAKLRRGDTGGRSIAQITAFKDASKYLLILHNSSGRQILEFEEGHEIGEFGM